MKYIRVTCFVALQLLASACLAGEARCGFTGREANTRVFLELKISESFEGSEYFQYCKMIAGEEFLYWDTYKAQKKLSLNSEQNRRVRKAFDAALKYNYADDTIGLDGSTWCISSDFGMTETRACFWSPNLNAKERGIEGVYQLKNALTQVIGK